MEIEGHFRILKTENIFRNNQKRDQVLPSRSISCLSVLLGSKWRPEELRKWHFLYFCKDASLNQFSRTLGADSPKSSAIDEKLRSRAGIISRFFVRVWLIPLPMRSYHELILTVPLKIKDLLRCKGELANHGLLVVLFCSTIDKFRNDPEELLIVRK